MSLRPLLLLLLPFAVAGACSIYDESLLEPGTSSDAATTTTATSSGQGGASTTASSTGGSGMGGAGTGGEAMGCTSPSECPGEDGECQTRTCEGGLCGFDFTAAGTPVAAQIAGDCQVVECDGGGGEQGTADVSDVPDDGIECTTDTCNQATPTFTPKASGTTCVQGGGHVCNADTDCVQCVLDADCVSNVCDDMFLCAPASCGDIVQNGNETDVDCGGSCPPCVLGDSCVVGADCLSGKCTGGVCAASCTDGLLNNGESDIDCGGPSCSPCDVGQTCVVGSDCTTTSCSGNVCACDGSHLMISEVRSRGAAGGNDEFVELYNPTNAGVTLDASWTLQGRSDTAGSYGTRWTGSGAVIPAHGHYLITRTVAGGYTQLPVGDASLTTGNTDATSLKLVQNAAIVDAVCYYYNATSLANLTDPLAGYDCEGTPVSNLPHTNSSGAASDVDVSIERRPGGAQGNCIDTGDSAADFVTLTPANPQSTASAPTP